MSKRTIVVLEVHDDQPDREWWQALGLPDPNSWNMKYIGEMPHVTHFPDDDDVHVTVVVES
jgi:hypothetical protein